MRDRKTVTHVAGVPGLEPRLTEPESVGLPITPYPISCSCLNLLDSERPLGSNRSAVTKYRGRLQRATRASDSCDRHRLAEDLDRLEERR